jgi:hypothetical protein
VGCGSGDGDGDSNAGEVQSPGVVSTAGGGDPSDGGASTATEEAGPSVTPELSATEEPTVAPATATPAELTFTTPQSGNGTKTAGSFGPFGIVYADSTFGVVLAQNRAQATAYVNVGINERPSASAWLVNLFRVPGEGTTPITVQISTGVNWQGILAGNGAGGTRAAVNISLSVLDGSRVVATEEVHSIEHRESVLTLGGFDDIDRADVDMQLALIPGRLYELRLTLTCEASSGFIGAATHCIYGPSDTYDAGFVAWEPRTILFVP